MKNFAISLSILLAPIAAQAQETVTLPKEQFMQLAQDAAFGCDTIAYSRLLAKASLGAGVTPETLIGIAFIDYEDGSPLADPDLQKKSVSNFFSRIPTALRQIMIEAGRDEDIMSENLRCTIRVSETVKQVAP